MTYPRFTTWWSVEHAFSHGLITLAEAHERATILLLEDLAETIHNRRYRERFHRLRGTVPVRTPIDGLDLLQAVADAIDAHDCKTRAYTWWREAEARGDDPETTHADWLGFAKADEIAVALVGAEDDWMVTGHRKVVRPLQRLMEAGYICRGEQNGQPYGYELTEDGAAVLEEARELVA